MPTSIMQCIANAAHSLNEALFVIGFKFQPQVAHVKFDNVGIAHEVVTPDFLYNAIAGNYLSRMGQ